VKQANPYDRIPGLSSIEESQKPDGLSLFPLQRLLA